MPVCATGVFVGATGVPVCAIGVFVGAMGVPVCATGVFVGATGVPVFATGVFVGATGVPVWGMRVVFGDTTPAPCAVGAPGAGSPGRIGIAGGAAGGAVVGLTAAGASIRGGATVAGGTIAGCETVVATVILGAAGATIGNDGAGGSGAVVGGRAVVTTTISRPAGRVTSICAPTGSAEKLPTIANRVRAIIPSPSCRTTGMVVSCRTCCGNAGLPRLAAPLFDARSCVRSRPKRETSRDIPFLHSCDTTPLIAAFRRPMPRVTMTPTRSIFGLICGSYPPHLFLANVVRKGVQPAVQPSTVNEIQGNKQGKEPLARYDVHAACCMSHVHR